jgi:FkbM family methyltransferase
MEAIALFLRKLRFKLFGSEATLFYIWTRLLALSILNLLSLGRGRHVKVAGIYPLKVEWSRLAIDFETWEAEFTKYFLEELKDPKIVFDIGASIGEWSALAAKLVGADKVHVFEPNLCSWNNIRRVFRLNRLSSPAGMFCGFCGNLDLLDPGLLKKVASKCWPPIVKGLPVFESLLNNATKDIATIKLDTYCDLYGVVPQVIKIDVEGAEGEVLQGSANVLNNYHPIIFLSLHPHLLSEFGTTKMEILKYIKDKGYICKLLSIDHEEHWICKPNE